MLEVLKSLNRSVIHRAFLWDGELLISDKFCHGTREPTRLRGSAKAFVATP